MVRNSACSVSFEGEKIVSEATQWCELDYRVGVPHRLQASLELKAARSGAAHGVCLWFETALLDDIGYSAAPGQPDNVYGQLFLPWWEPVELQAGQAVLVELHADHVGDDYIWRWISRFPGPNGAPPRVFSQSTLEGARFTPEILQRRSSTFVPKLSESAAVESWVMQRMDGTRSLQEIAAEALARFPAVLRNSREALQLVSRLADKFAR